MSAANRIRGAARSSTAEFDRFLQRLAHGDALIDDGEGLFGLESRRGGVDAGISREAVQALERAGLLNRDGNRLVLSDAGHARLRRNSAKGDEPFRVQHQRRRRDIHDVEGVRQAVLINDGESPLGWLRSRKDRAGRPLIGQEQFEAGERLRADYWFARMSPRVTANWQAMAPHERVRRGAPADAGSLRDEVLAAKDRVMGALAAVGPEVSSILVDICCELKGLEEAEKANGWPQRAGKVVLQIALTRLAKHYGLIAEPDMDKRPLRHWGQGDFKPRIDGGRDEPDIA